jgi:hypothetical protein
MVFNSVICTECRVCGSVFKNFRYESGFLYICNVKDPSVCLFVVSLSSYYSKSMFNGNP